MKYIRFILILPVFFALGAFSQKTIILNNTYNHMDFEGFCLKIESEFNTRIYYDKEISSEINIKLSKENETLEEALIETFQNVGVFIFFDKNNNVFITKRKINMFDEKNFFSVINGQNNVVNNTVVNDNDQTKEYFIENVSIGEKGSSETGICLVTVKLINNEDGLPVVGAMINEKNTTNSKMSDNMGFFSMKLSKGIHSVIIKSLDFEEQEYRFNVLSSGSIELGLNKKLYALDEVVVSTEYNNVTNNKIGFEKITSEKIKELPNLLGERDIIKSALFLPGVQSVGEGASGFNVRGSPTDQNMFYIGNIPIYNTSHFFGFFSSFNSDAIKDFTLYKSNLPGKYGGKLASVFELTPKTGNKLKFSARGGVSPVTGKLMIEGPIKQSGSYLLALRSTYSDYILNLIKYQNIDQSKVNFGDAFMNLSFSLKNNNTLKFLSYFSYDKIKMFPGIQYNYKNLGAEINWNWFFNKDNYLNLSLLSSNYNYEESDLQYASLSYNYNYAIRHNEIKADFLLIPAYNHKLSLGFNSILYFLDRGSFSPIGDSSIYLPKILNKEYATESGVYIQENWDINDHLNVGGSLRYNFYSMLGPTNTFYYGNNEILSDLTFVDTLNYKVGKIIRPNHNLDYRFSINYIFSKNHSLKAGFNRSHQYIFMLNNTISISPSDTWKLSDYNIEPMSGNHYSFGLFSNIFNNRINTSVEIYYKNTRNLVEFKDGAELLAIQYPEREVLQGNLKAYGIEFMVKKSLGRINGWINYTYSVAHVTVNNPLKELTINSGKTYPSNYDKPHSFNSVLNYKFSRRFSISVNTVYSTGRPVTYPSAVYYINDLQLLYYSDRNRYRLHDYFRIDLSLNLEGNLKSKKLAHSSWSLSVYNLTGRNNAYSVFFRIEDNKIQGYQLSIFGSPIVSITYNFKLGNYLN